MRNDTLPAPAGLPFAAGCGAAEYPGRLLEYAAQQGLLTAHDQARINRQMFAFFQQYLARFTQQESSSVPVETAQNLLHALLYSIGYGLKPLPPAKAISLFSSAPPEQLYRQGQAQLQAGVQTARHLWQAARAAKITTPNKPYNYSLFKGIGAFFSGYSIAFAPQETPADLDYPLCVFSNGFTGVEYMQEYVWALLLENRFVCLFAPGPVHRALLSRQPLYSELPINIFETVLLCALGCTLSGQPPAGLLPNKAALAALNERLLRCGVPVAAFLQKGGARLCGALAIKAPELQAYLQKALRANLPQLQAAAAHRQLPAFFVCENSG
ncbi:MAG: DUF6179 domain-containing protein [Oscillospiraceae bacterium]